MFGLGLGFGVALVLRLLVGQTVPDQEMLLPPQKRSQEVQKGQDMTLSKLISPFISVIVQGHNTSPVRLVGKTVPDQ